MKTVQAMLAEAEAVVPRISPEEAKALLGRTDVLFLDVREPAEVAASGKVPGALSRSREDLWNFAPIRLRRSTTRRLIAPRRWLPIARQVDARHWSARRSRRWDTPTCKTLAASRAGWMQAVRSKRDRNNRRFRSYFSDIAVDHRLHLLQKCICLLANLGSTAFDRTPM
jgi:rhodanese-related sulfurtransferase